MSGSRARKASHVGPLSAITSAYGSPSEWRLCCKLSAQLLWIRSVIVTMTSGSTALLERSYQHARCLEVVLHHNVPPASWQARKLRYGVRGTKARQGRQLSW